MIHHCPQFRYFGYYGECTRVISIPQVIINPVRVLRVLYIRYTSYLILSDLIYARVFEPKSKRSTFSVASEFLEKPTYELHDIYRALDVLGNECDLIQSEVYKNSQFLGKRNDKILFYDCTNYYFEIELCPCKDFRIFI